MYCVVEIGSRMLRLECGTTRRTLSCAVADEKTTRTAAAMMKRRMRKSPGSEATRRRLTGHSTHRNPSTAASPEGHRAHGACAALARQPNGRDGRHRARGNLQQLRTGRDLGLAGRALLVVSPRQGGAELFGRQAAERWHAALSRRAAA